jgi:glycogen synthase
MKVMMFGWEFPPHISGGLGTACHGMTRGLAHHGVEVLFVVPRAFGDEDRRFVSVIGANDVAVLEEAREIVRAAQSHEPTSGTPRIRREGRTTIVDEAWARVGDLVRTLAIESPLTPYLTALEYQDRLERLEESGSTRRAEALAALEELIRIPMGDDAGEEIVRRILQSGKLPFFGGYGPTLMAEVARFAVVAAQVAREQTFDVVHCHDWMTLPAGLAASRASGRPLVFHVHACEYDRSGEHVNVRVRDIEQLGLDG